MPPRVTRRPAVRSVASSKLPDSLAARLFLLAYDPATGRLVSRSKLGQMLRAAALIDLQLNGQLVDEDDRAHVKVQAGRPRNAITASVLDDISASSPRRWRHWIDRHHRGILREVRDELVHARLIKVESHRRFWVIPAERITLRQPLVRRQLLLAATDTLRPARLVTRIDLRDAAIVVLAATGDLRTVLSKDQRVRHKDRLAQLAVRVGPVVPALRKSFQAAASGAAG